MTKKFFINRKMLKMLKMPKVVILNAENFKDGARMIKLTKCSFPNGERKWRTFLKDFTVPILEVILFVIDIQFDQIHHI